MKPSDRECAVQIAVRERPILHIFDAPEQINIQRQDNNIFIDGRCFPFDQVMGPDVTQEEMYNAIVQPLVRKAIEGFHCTILAYGQTGTGKSHTMGLQTDEFMREHDGMVPRTLIECFADENLNISISFIEIYNEKVYDLLAESNGEISSAKKFVSNRFAKRPVHNLVDAQIVLKEGNKNRHVRPTKMNSFSSRSHAIFTIHLMTSKMKSAINLVDLAGSEGVRRTGHQGLALTEGVNINQGLLSVRKVLQALALGNKVIPYRDSVLSFALKDSLHANSFFTLIACISSLREDVNETIATLRFAQDSKSVKSTPQINALFSPNKTLRTPLYPNTPMNTIPILVSSTAYATTKRKPIHSNTFSTPNKIRRMENNKQNHTTVGITPIRNNERVSVCSNLFDANSLLESSAKTFLDVSSSTLLGDPRHSVAISERFSSVTSLENPNPLDKDDSNRANCSHTTMNNKLSELLSKMDRMEKTIQSIQNSTFQSLIQSDQSTAKYNKSPIKRSVPSSFAPGQTFMTTINSTFADMDNTVLEMPIQKTNQKKTMNDNKVLNTVENQTNTQIFEPKNFIEINSPAEATENVDMQTTESEETIFRIPEPPPNRAAKSHTDKENIPKRRSVRVVSTFLEHPIQINKNEFTPKRRNTRAVSLYGSLNQTSENEVIPKRRSARISSYIDSRPSNNQDLIQTNKNLIQMNENERIPMRRSARISSHIGNRPSDNEMINHTCKACPTLTDMTNIIPKVIRQNGKKTTANFLRQLEVKSGKMTKKQAMKEHESNILKMINSGDMQMLKMLPMIGTKTAYILITHRSLHGKFKSLDDVSKLPVWRGKSWIRFREQNNLASK